MVLLVVGFTLSGCARGRSDDASPPPGLPSPRVAIEGAQMSEVVGHEKVWDLKADHIDYRTDQRIADLVGVKARFYEQGRVVSMGDAPRAVFNLGDRQLRLEGGISVKTPKNDTGFEARSATWQPAQGRLAAEGGVRYWRGRSRLAAENLVANRSLGRVELAGGVAGQLALKEFGTGERLFPSNPLTP